MLVIQGRPGKFGMTRTILRKSRIPGGLHLDGLEQVYLDTPVQHVKGNRGDSEATLRKGAVLGVL